MMFLIVPKKDGNDDICSNELRQEMQQNGGGAVLMLCKNSNYALEKQGERDYQHGTLKEKFI